MKITLRKQPYPYMAMLAICSDLDETPDAKSYFELSKFLNTSTMTSLGRGVDLEVGNTIYFGMPEDQFSFFNCTDADRAGVIELINSGHIDCLHSFGDNVNTRADIEAIWNLLPTNKIKVWIDHARAPSNFDADIMFGEGAVENGRCYHADLAIENGITFVWKGRVSSIVAQDSRISLSGILSSKQPVASAKTVLKEIAKIVMAVFGSDKYSMHKFNKLTRKTQLDSGQEIIEFMRSNPSWGGVSHFETADGIGQIINSTYLEQLCRQQGNSILYTHLGKTKSRSILPLEAVKAFQTLAKYNRSKKVLVTTTSRLLAYNHLRETLRWAAVLDNNLATIRLQSNIARELLQGLSWLAPTEVQKARLVTNEGDEIELNIDSTQSSSKVCLSLPWKKMNYPPMEFKAHGQSNI